MPTIDAAGAASLLRWLMAAVVLAGLLWFVDGWITRRVGRSLNAASEGCTQRLHSERNG